jgi:nucleoside-diphosphate-sugar epimerase
MKRLALVTGGAGFIGSHLAAGLLARGYSVRILDDFSSGREGNLESIADRIQIVHGDAADPATVQDAVAGASVVFHEAAQPSVQRSVEDPVGAHRRNLEATLVLLDAARRAGTERFVFAGSSSAYGNDPEVPKQESMRPAPLSPYAAQKMASEHYCRAFAECYGLKTAVLRYFNVYGPRQDPRSPYSGVISLFATTLLAARAPKIYGDGEQTRDFVYVADVVAANLAAAEVAAERLTPGATFNVAGGRAISVNELFRVVRAAVGGAAARIDPQYEPARLGDVRHSVADLARARSVLDYRPSIELERGIAATVDHYRKEIGS